ncbi:MAG: ABC transporter ATP-binding protein [Ignavibacteriota bacterium]|jgi:putative ABC transport system ATP-binding protein|nr:ABC transporter ATP-binding protein [Ignavibacteriota bacterium]MBV6420878.1 putative ABC transporter ATP-binding protein [Ignavibacteriaceae bacterium]MCO6446850.1 ABC transporter ATP-binding protein [Ignavibacterium album]MDT3696731.1 ABC transporter ATP-binding protein [Ignavibacterium sp.]QKJ99289.1 MAG: ABC transporter ATP-binding protein [Ignavibacteriota bacterium]
MSLIQINNLTKEYKSGNEKVTAVNNISLEIKQGEFISLMGESGSGKSTLLTMIGGLNKPTNGNIIIDEIDIYNLSPNSLADFRREYIGIVFQSFQLIPYLTVIENVQLPLATNGHSKKLQAELASSILNKVHLESKRKRLINELSGGEQQRVAIARALINDPLILLTDEPTGNLDSKTSEDIMNIFLHLNQAGKSIIMVTHNADFKKYSSRNINLSDGKLVC